MSLLQIKLVDKKSGQFTLANCFETVMWTKKRNSFLLTFFQVCTVIAFGKKSHVTVCMNREPTGTDINIYFKHARIFISDEIQH